MSLAEAQKDLESECPDRDINFEDVCKEMLDQSKSTRVQKHQKIHLWAFATQFSQVKEAERSAEHPLPHSDIISLEEQPTRGSMEQSFSGEETLIQSQFP